MPELLRVAIAAEADEYDARIYETILANLLKRGIEQWDHGYRFSGCNHVRALAPAFLSKAADAGIAHALLAIDNDGGQKRRPEHSPDHVIADEAKIADGCRTCWLEEAVPEAWRAHGKHCVVVPVQTIETWLCFLRGDTLSNPIPEKNYDRRVLKKLFFGDSKPPLEERLKLALQLVERGDAIERLRERPSFSRFADQVAGWT